MEEGESHEFFLVMNFISWMNEVNEVNEIAILCVSVSSARVFLVLRGLPSWIGVVGQRPLCFFLASFWPAVPFFLHVSKLTTWYFGRFGSFTPHFLSLHIPFEP